jgi:hypothetical protein
MIISKTHKFLFVHIQRTGGTSISRHLLDAQVNADQFLAPHAPVLDAKKLLSADYHDYFTFAFVRNPWDRLVSWYHMIKTYGPGNTTNQFWAYVLANSTCFEEFIKNCTETIVQDGSGKSIMWNQVDYLSDSKGTIVVDAIGRFENYARDVRGIFNRIKVPFDTLCSANAVPHAHYSAYYTPELREIVATRFKKDTEHFGYRYESPD